MDRKLQLKEFNNNIINLDTKRTKVARKSRNWLIKQLENLPEKDDSFPDLYEGKHIQFGSFARSTKIRELDDIDLILTFSAKSSTHTILSYGKHYRLNVPEEASKLRKLCNDDNTLNSIKLVNKIVSALDNIEHYKSADKHRRQEAATLQLNSYEWNFDIVPAFYTTTGYYLIPDGNGEWKATDPRVDQQRTTDINQKHNGKILQIIRTLKYWNRRVKMPTISSYLLESLVLNYFDSVKEIPQWVDVNMIYFWEYLKTAIKEKVPDPKGFQDDLNTLTTEEQNKISTKANETHSTGLEAHRLETREENQEKAIKKWGEIFGDEFPTYD